MATYGLQINDENGDNVYDSTVSTWLQVGQFEFPAMAADVRFVRNVVYNTGDFVRIVVGNEGNPGGRRWERIGPSGATDEDDPQTENDANEAAGLPLNWQRAETTITWNPSIDAGFSLLTQIQLVDTPPDDQEGFIPSVVTGVNVMTVTTFAFRPSERVIVIVLAKGG